MLDFGTTFELRIDALNAVGCCQSQAADFLEVFLDFGELTVAELFGTGWLLILAIGPSTFTPQDFVYQ